MDEGFSCKVINNKDDLRVSVVIYHIIALGCIVVT